MNANDIQGFDFLTLENRITLRERIVSSTDSICFQLLTQYSDFGITEDVAIKEILGRTPNLGQLKGTKGFKLSSAAYKAINCEVYYAKELIVLEDNEGKVHIVTRKPDMVELLKEVIRMAANKNYVLEICTNEIWQALYRFYVEPESIRRKAAMLSDSEDDNTSHGSIQLSDARRLYRELINIGILKKASDVHFIPCKDSCQVHYRVDGINELYGDIPKQFLDRVRNLLITDASMSVPNQNKPADGKMRYSPSGDPSVNDMIDIRISIIPTKGGPDINLRYLTNKLYSLSGIGMSPARESELRKLIELRAGLIIQVGPTGSGKSTSLYSALDIVRQSLRNVIAVEDPVEILMDGISQIDVAMEGGMSYAEALKASMRHDPDVLVIGEIRDRDTAFEAIRAANTGHLVFATLHTIDAISSFERLFNLGIDAYSLGEVLAAIIGQRLIRRLCPHCKEEVMMDIRHPDLIDFHLWNYVERGVKEIKLYKPHGCSKCWNTGYSGRVAVNEIMQTNDKMRALIQRHSLRTDYERALTESRFCSIYFDAVSKMLDGLTSYEEVKPMASDIMAFKGFPYNQEWGRRSEDR